MILFVTLLYHPQTSDTETFYGKDALVYGWGTTSSGGASSSVLLEVGFYVSVQITASPHCTVCRWLCPW